MFVRRVRGVLLRLVRRRWLASGIGVAMVVPAAWVELSGCCGAWWVKGLSLLFGATGVALVWTGLTGVRPDWIDTQRNS
jgi:hypothetical protein